MGRTAALLACCALFSRFLGLLRDLSMAWLVGAGPLGDALVAALRVPHAIRRLLGEGALSVSLTADLVRLGRGRRIPASLIHALLWRHAAVRCLALLVIGLTASAWLSRLMAPGFDEWRLAQATDLFRLSFPYVPLALPAALCMALLHSRFVFGPSALAPAVFNATALSFAGMACVGLMPPAAAIATGMAAGGLAQWLWQLGACRLATSPEGQGPPCPTPQGARLRRHAATLARICLNRLPVGLIAAAAPQCCLVVSSMLVSFCAASKFSALYYAERLLEVPLGVVGACLGMASLPVLGKLAAQRALPDFALQLSRALRWSLLLAIPATAGLWCVAPLLSEALLRHGAFDASAARDTAGALRAYLPALTACALSRPLLSACCALGEVRHAALAAVLSVCLVPVFWWPASRFPGGAPWSAAPLSAGLALWAHAALLCMLAARAARRLDKGLRLARILPPMGAVARFCLGGAALAVAVTWALRSCPAPGAPWPALALGMAIGAAVYAAVLFLLRDPDFMALCRMVSRKGNRG